MVKVKDLMVSNLITVDARKSLEYALGLMREHGIRRLPVLEGDILRGIIVQHDIEIALRRAEVIPETPVEWVMTKNPLVTTPDTELADAIEVLVVNKISALPVVEAGNLVGILSEIDVLKLLVYLLRKLEEPICEKILDLL